MQSLTVSAQPLYPEPISPFIYGDFVEFINDLIPGMWAEKVRDRSFEGSLQPRRLWLPEEDWTGPFWRPFVAGEPAADCWPADGAALRAPQPRVSFTLDQYAPFVGRQSACVEVESGAEAPFVAGIGQPGIAVRAGQALAFEMYLRGPGLEDVPLQVLLGRNYGAFFRTYARLQFVGAGEDWLKFTGSLVPDVTDEQAELAIGISQPGTFWLDKVSLLPDDNLSGWRPDVVGAVRALRPGMLRFGGSSLIYYQWQDGIGPRERRAPFENRPWGNREENDTGLHEFLQFCELAGAQPLLCANSNNATLQQVLDEIEYCNGRLGTRYGDSRAAAGHPQPFNVSYWQIGNEQSGPLYERTLTEYARAIRQRHPELTLLASYPSDRLLDDLSPLVDYVCPHLYDPYSPAMEEQMRALATRIRQGEQSRHLKLAVTEWNHTGGHWGPARAWLLTLYNALNAGRMLNMYQRLGDSIRIANRSNLVNSSCSGSIQTGPTGLYFTPAYHVQRAYANLSGDTALTVHAGTGEVLDLSATRRGSAGPVSLAAVNCTAETQARQIDLADLALSSPLVRTWTLAGPALQAVNSFEDPDCVAPNEGTMERRASFLSYTFPAYSLTILHFC
jgi:alpha-L-arabinofuranosidase